MTGNRINKCNGSFLAKIDLDIKARFLLPPHEKLRCNVLNRFLPETSGAPKWCVKLLHPWGREREKSLFPATLIGVFEENVSSLPFSPCDTP